MRWAMVVGIALLATTARAATVTVTPADSFDKIENAQPGDEVVIAPGTYAFRVMLTRQAPASSPIVIRAQDPQHPPVWDMGTTLVENAPGSATAGDRGRGCWQVVGGTNYVIDTIVFLHCRTASHNSAGIRYWNNVHGLVIRNCVFRENDNGITGGNVDSDAIVEFSEFDRNGNLAATGGPTHNLYIYGGTFTLRYSYVHDPVQAQNFHIRAQNGTLAYNWFARGKSYEGDLMTDDDFTGGEAQSMLLVGNVIVQSQTPDNNGQIVAVYNDNRTPNVTLSVRLVNNTLYGNGGNAAVVHLSNADGTTMHAEVSNNILFGTTRATLVETPGAATVSGTNNWMATGASAGGLAGTLFSATPGFRDAANKDFTLAPGSAAIGRADSQVMNLAAAEYFRDETLTRMYRQRLAAHDLGAFESTTIGPGIGPGGGAGGAGGSGGAGGLGGGAGGTGGSGGVATGGSGGNPGSGTAEAGCGCTVGAAALPLGGLVLIVIAVLVLRFRRSE